MPVNLLIVDDSEPIRCALRALLGHVPGIASIREAATLAQALECVRSAPPDLVILDLFLPDGLSTRIIQPLKQLAPAPLVAVFTIRAESLYRQHCLALGADWFFDKGNETDALLDLIRQVAMA